MKWLESGMSFGPYTVLVSITRGAQRMIFEARHQETGARVALNVLREGGEEARRFLEDTQRLIGLEHPSLPRVHESGEHGGRAFVATEYVEGNPLGTHVRRHGLPTLAWTVRVLGELAEALTCCHEAGLVDRDLTPADVVIAGEEERPVLVGFALFGSQSRPGAGSHPGFLPPDRLEGSSTEVGPWTDVYALGVLLYYLLTGEPPFSGPRRRVIEQVLETAPPDPTQTNSTVSPALARLVQRALAKAPDQRPASAAAFARELREAVSDV